MLKTIRRILAVLFLLGLTMLFLDFTGTVHPWLGWMAKVQFLPSLMGHDWITVVIVLALTLVFGRIYCSVICPLGVMQDIFSWIGRQKIFRKNKKAKLANNYSYSKPKTWLRLAVLVLFIVMMVAGYNAFAVMLAPYSMYGKIVTSLIQPIYISINNLLADWSEANDNFMFYQVEPHNNPLIFVIISGVIALVLAVLAFIHGRTYCNTICPGGTLLAIFAKFSLLKVKADDSKCIQCGLCAKNCKAACIKVEKGQPIQIDYTRCVTCGNCETVCSKNALAYSLPKKAIKAKAEAPKEKDDMSRRTFLAVTGTAVAAAAIDAQEKTTDGGLAAIEDKQIPERKTRLVPAGALSIKNLEKKCTSCQLCIANCPNGVLRPSQNMENFWQPEMQYDKGYCRPECTKCSEVCPASAIKPITKEEKTAIQIGHAVWIKKNCIPISYEVTCGNCAAHCPSGAIQMIPVDSTLVQNDRGAWNDKDGNWINDRDVLKIPVVNTEKCIGCGACENLCPARPFSAIYVEGHEVHREI